MAKFMMKEVVDLGDVITARLGSGQAVNASGVSTGNGMTDADVGKFVKVVAESRYDLCAVGDQIEGRVSSVETATQDGYTIGSVQIEAQFLEVTFDGLQATPGTGTIAINDYVVTGTPVARGTSLTFGTPAKVCKATAAANTLINKWRVVSLGSAGTGAVGTVGVIQQVGC